MQHIKHGIILANQKTESVVFCWLSAHTEKSFILELFFDIPNFLILTVYHVDSNLRQFLPCPDSVQPQLHFALALTYF